MNITARWACLSLGFSLLGVMPGLLHAAPRAPARGALERPANGAEIKAFDEFHARQFPGHPAAQVEFTVRRERAGRPWRVVASVAAAPARLAGGVCHLERTQYSYDARARPAQRWSMEAQGQQLVWLATGAACPAPARPVQLLGAVADGELAGLLAQQTALLDRARLLLAGNTQCAPLRALPFTLQAIDVQAPVAGKIAMPGLVFESDRGSRATVWVRRSGRELLAWSATCH